MSLRLKTSLSDCLCVMLPAYNCDFSDITVQRGAPTVSSDPLPLQHNTLGVVTRLLCQPHDMRFSQ